jgi:hypothetical protein
MQSTLDIDRLRELLGVMVFDSAHEPVGTVNEVFYDEATTRPSWLGVAVAPSATSRILVPLESALIGGGGLTFPYTKDFMRRAPSVAGDLGGAQEEELRAYYRLSPLESSGHKRSLT